jgi:hypothetical protein
VGVKYSPDVDVYVKSLKILDKMTKEFIKKGWKNYERAKNEREVWSRLEKKGTNFDIACSRKALKFFFDDRVAIKAHGYKIYFISKEALFLSKMRLLLSKERTLEKRKRDFEAVIRLHKKIDKKKAIALASKLSQG